MKLEKFNYGNGKRSRWFLYGVICTVLLMVLVNLFLSQAKYLNTEKIKLAEGTMSYKPYDFKIMAMYQENEEGEYQEIDSMPISGYVINEEKSYCTLDNINKDNNAILKTTYGNHTISNLQKNEKCYLYFKNIKNISDLVNSKKLSYRNTDLGKEVVEITNGKIYITIDNDGETYYFTGAPTDNWVKFAGFYWRIVRINGDGTMRIIYSGSEESGPATTGEGTQIGISAFNEEYDDNAYVGYMYGTPGSSTYEETHANLNDSTIKTYIDNWYKQNLINYENYIDINAGFCNDRKTTNNVYSGYSALGYGKTYSSYASAGRIYENNSPKVPTTSTLQCGQSVDLFTIKTANKGNKALTYPIGLITADETIFAGAGILVSNCYHFMCTEYEYWTMSPSDFNGTTSFHLYVLTTGRIHVNNGVSYKNRGVRPVINLKADTQFSRGDGTINNPYVVS